LRNATYEIRHRHGLDWPYVTATVALPSRSGSDSNAKVVLGHVAPVPWVSEAASRALGEGTVNESMAEKCGEAATQGAKPLSRNAYKVPMVKAAVKRAVLSATKA
jgi:xanthine dehydrogenase YagS FAD-binding subunit